MPVLLNIFESLVSYIVLTPIIIALVAELGYEVTGVNTSFGSFFKTSLEFTATL